MMAQALERYLKKARPGGFSPHVFLSLRSPYRALSGNGVYLLTRSLLDRLAIASNKRGPHSLRHACASYLLNSGLSLKGVGDHLAAVEITHFPRYSCPASSRRRDRVGEVFCGSNCG